MVKKTAYVHFRVEFQPPIHRSGISPVSCYNGDTNSDCELRQLCMEGASPPPFYALRLQLLRFFRFPSPSATLFLLLFALRQPYSPFYCSSLRFFLSLCRIFWPWHLSKPNRKEVYWGEKELAYPSPIQRPCEKVLSTLRAKGRGLFFLQLLFFCLPFSQQHKRLRAKMYCVPGFLFELFACSPYRTGR